VIVALELEARTLDVFSAEPQMRVYVSGPGRERARAAARHAIADGAGALLAWGMAGALRADGESGDVVVPARVLSASGEWDTDAVWRRRIAAALAARFEIGESALFSSVEVIARPEAKRALGERTGAHAIDMETAAVAEVAAEAGRPCIAIRVIVDRQRDALPEGIEALMAADGRTRHRGLWPLLLRPSRIPPLVVLARRSRVAQGVLRDVAGTLRESAV